MKQSTMSINGTAINQELLTVFFIFNSLIKLGVLSSQYFFFLCCMLRFLNHLVQWNSCNFPLILRQDSARGLALFKSVITSHFLFRRFLCWLVLIYLFIMFIVCSSRTCKGSSKFEWKVGDCWSNYQGWFAFFYCRFVGKLDITSFQREMIALIFVISCQYIWLYLRNDFFFLL